MFKPGTLIFSEKKDIFYLILSFNKENGTHAGITWFYSQPLKFWYWIEETDLEEGERIVFEPK